jgi:hypothetical protein
MCDLMRRMGLTILQLYFFNFDVGILRMDRIFQHPNGILIHQHDPIVVSKFRIVPVTFFLLVLQQFAQHVNGGCLVLFHHAPEVADCYGEGTLGSKASYLFSFDTVKDTQGSMSKS